MPPKFVYNEMRRVRKKPGAFLSMQPDHLQTFQFPGGQIIYRHFNFGDIFMTTVHAKETVGVRESHGQSGRLTGPKATHFQ